MRRIVREPEPKELDPCARCGVKSATAAHFLCDSCRAKHYAKFPLEQAPFVEPQRWGMRRREERRTRTAEHRADHQTLHQRLDELERRLLAVEPRGVNVFFCVIDTKSEK